MWITVSWNRYRQILAKNDDACTQQWLVPSDNINQNYAISTYNPGKGEDYHYNFLEFTNITEGVFP